MAYLFFLTIPIVFISLFTRKPRGLLLHSSFLIMLGLALFGTGAYTGEYYYYYIGFFIMFGSIGLTLLGSRRMNR